MVSVIYNDCGMDKSIVIPTAFQASITRCTSSEQTPNNSIAASLDRVQLCQDNFLNHSKYRNIAHT